MELQSGMFYWLKNSWTRKKFKPIFVSTNLHYAWKDIDCYIRKQLESVAVVLFCLMVGES